MLFLPTHPSHHPVPVIMTTSCATAVELQKLLGVCSSCLSLPYRQSVEMNIESLCKLRKIISLPERWADGFLDTCADGDMRTNVTSEERASASCSAVCSSAQMK